MLVMVSFTRGKTAETCDHLINSGLDYHDKYFAGGSGINLRHWKEEVGWHNTTCCSQLPGYSLWVPTWSQHRAICHLYYSPGYFKKIAFGDSYCNKHAMPFCFLCQIENSYVNALDTSESEIRMFKFDKCRIASGYVFHYQVYLIEGDCGCMCACACCLKFTLFIDAVLIPMFTPLYTPKFSLVST